MTNYLKFFLIFLFSAAASGALAQQAGSATTSSPYSKFGLGDYDESLLPQQRGMGGIGVAVRKPSGFSDINVLNPASYSSIQLTTFDIGGYMGTTSLKTSTTGPQTSANFRLSHITLAVPVSKQSALSFGILPYANLGYSYRQQTKTTLNRASTGGIDTSATVNNVYSGEGGLSKAYIGYGFGLGENLNLGFNVAYIFGNEKQYRSTEFPDIPTVLNNNIENSFNASGLNFDYGVQYNLKVSETRRFTVGYSGSSSSQLNANSNFVVTQYLLATDGTADVPRDSLISTKTSGKINLPMIHRFGIAYQKDGKFMIGADYKIGQWSDLSIGGVNSGLKNSQSFALGGEIIPNIDAISNYLSVVDYRFGLKYDKTYINVNGTDIKQYAATFGLGLPIPNERRTSYYKVNIAAEVGRRGTLENSLVRETYFNLHIGFTINDKWFQKYKFD
ncbi:hypothetical protein BDD43_1653 [Mucilaginibacter gracilis]|uniref:Long-subunit fatty acid transport protein n=1 Tax=Mucilaginibacter gracilis TaxID=423350 RepID=A0A495IXS8_9SPHI|nr:hypothetical protein [Mucilaginibacter gracilis]RKR81506.1 hypothetical protein BDD43_1653 [Mucilaginibacter gracilis]